VGISSHSKDSPAQIPGESGPCPSHGRSTRDPSRSQCEHRRDSVCSCSLVPLPLINDPSTPSSTDIIKVTNSVLMWRPFQNPHCNSTSASHPAFEVCSSVCCGVLHSLLFCTRGSWRGDGGYLEEGEGCNPTVSSCVSVWLVEAQRSSPFHLSPTVTHGDSTHSRAPL
jgi:hypothetical protein